MPQNPLKPLLAPLFDKVAQALADRGISPHLITFAAFMATLCVFVAIGMQIFWLALIFILINRALDTLDGMVARLQNRESAFGAFLDTFADVFLASGAIFMMVLGGNSAFATPALYLLFTWLVNAACSRAFEKAAISSNLPAPVRSLKSLVLLDGVSNQTETTLVLILICLLPQYFPVIAIFYGSACLMASFARAVLARRHLK